MKELKHVGTKQLSIIDFNELKQSLIQLANECKENGEVATLNAENKKRNFVEYNRYMV